MNNPKLIGIIGKNGAGKTAVCDYLKTKGFSVISLSDIVRKIAAEKELSPTRDNLVAIGNELKQTKGAAILAELAFQNAKDQGFTQCIFDSIRNTAEVLFFKQHQVHMIGVDAPIEIRYQRIQERKRETDKIDFQTFCQHDERENNGQSFGQNINASLKYCDILLDNSKSLSDLHQKMDNHLKKLWEL